MLPLNLRDKFFQIQEEITSSLRTLVLADTNSQASAVSGNSGKNFESVRLDAGADLLNHYQFQWCRMREAADHNYRLAEQVDKAVELLGNYINYQKSLADMLFSGLSSVTTIITQLEKLNSNIAQTETIFHETEENLVILEDLIKEQHLQSKMQDYRNKVRALEDEKIAELQKLKNQLALEHTKKIAEFESVLALKAKERQAIFEEAFEKELEQYKLSGYIPKSILPNSQQRTTLEDIIVEDDSSALNQFLDDV